MLGCSQNDSICLLIAAFYAKKELSVLPSKVADEKTLGLKAAILKKDYSFQSIPTNISPHLVRA